MGSKRSASGWRQLRERLYAGMAERGIPGEVADQLYDKLEAFANYGFPESPRGVASPTSCTRRSWIKQLRAGSVLRGAAQRPADGLLVAAHAVPGRPPPRGEGAQPRPQHLGGDGDARTRARASTGGELAVRLGLGSVRKLGQDLPNGSTPSDVAARAVRETWRISCGGCRSWSCRTWRCSPRPGRSGASASTGREAAWAAGARDREPGRPAAAASPPAPPPAPAGHGAGRGSRRRSVGHGHLPDGHLDEVPARAARRPGVVTSAGLWDLRPGQGGRGGGRHPSPAADDRARHNVPQPGRRDRADQHRRVEGLLEPLPARRAQASAMLVRGRVERSEGVINVVAERLDPLALPASTIHASRDFR